MNNKIVNIDGKDVALYVLRNDVSGAYKKGLGGKFAFTPETAEALLNEIADMHSRLVQIEKLAKE